MLEELITTPVRHTPQSPIIKFLRRIEEVQRDAKVAGASFHRLDIGMLDLPNKLDNLGLSIPFGNDPYTSEMGYDNLREIVASENDVPVRFVGITDGGSEANEFAVDAVVDPAKGEKVLVFPPAFAGFMQTLSLKGIETVPVLTRFEDGFRPSRDEDHLNGMIERANTTGKVKLMYVNSPSNPTGHVNDIPHLRMLARIATRNRMAVLFDKVYDFSIFEGEIPDYFGIFGENLILTDSYSKKFNLPRARVGYIIAPSEDFWELALRKESQKRLCPNGYGQDAVLKAYQHLSRSYLRSVYEEYKRRVEIIASKLNKLDHLGVNAIKPQGGPYIVAKVDGVDIEVLMNEVLLSDNFWKAEGGTLSLVPLRGGFYDKGNDELGRTEVRFVMREPLQQLLEAVRLFERSIIRYKEFVGG